MIEVIILVFLVLGVGRALWALCQTGGSGGMARQQPLQVSGFESGAVAAKVPAVMLPRFSSGDGGDFMRRVERVRIANAWTQDTVLRLLPTCLDGPGLAAFERLSEKEKVCLESIKRALNRTNLASLSLQQFHKMYWREGQSVTQFVCDLQTCLEASGIPELAETTKNAMIRSQLICGMPVEIQPHLISQPVECPLENIVECANRLLACRQGCAFIRTSEVVQGPTQLQEIMSRLEKLEGRGRDIRSRYGFSGKCFKCGGLGHRAAECITQTTQGNENRLLFPADRQSM